MSGGIEPEDGQIQRQVSTCVSERFAAAKTALIRSENIDLAADLEESAHLAAEQEESIRAVTN